QETALVEHHCGSGLAFGQQIAKGAVHQAHVLVNELGQCGHAQAGRRPLSLMNLWSNKRVIMLSDSNTPSQPLATAVNDGTCTSRLFIKNSMYSTGATLGKSRLLYC